MSCDPGNEPKMTLKSLLIETGEMNLVSRHNSMVKFGFGGLLPQTVYSTTVNVSFWLTLHFKSVLYS